MTPGFAMTPVSIRVRAELRRGWISWAMLAVLIGLGGGAVLTAAAGARRTDTAYSRFLLGSNASDEIISPQHTGLPSYYSALARLPGVRAIGTVAGINALPQQALPFRPDDPAAGVAVIGTADNRLGFDLDRQRVVSGRMFRTDRADEAIIDRNTARILHLHVGSSLTLVAFKNNQGPSDPTAGRQLSVRVVGVVVDRTKVVSLTRLDGQPRVELTPTAVSELGSDYIGFDGAFVRLAKGVSPDAFGRQAQELAARYPETGSGPSTVFFSNEADQVARVEQAIRPQGLALAMFALVAGIAVWLVVGQLVSRQLFLASTENSVLRALGMSRGQLMAVGLAEVAETAATGGLLAIATSIAISPLTPIGPARLAEPHPGVQVNFALAGVGFTAILVLVVLRAAWPAWRLGSQRSSMDGNAAIREAERPSAVGELAARVGMPPSATVGLRLALEPGRGQTAIPVRSTLIGAVLSVATVAAALTFGTNLSRLVHTPALYGQTWDLAVDGQFITLPTAQVSAVLHRQPGVVAWSFGDYGDVTIGGHEVGAIGIDAGSGPLVFPSLLDGRPPAAVDEIVLGSKVLQRIGRRVGQSVTVTMNGQPRVMRVVGRAVFPDLGRGSFTTTDLGDGAALSPQLLAQPLPGSSSIYNFLLIRFSNVATRTGGQSRFLNELGQTFRCTQDNGNCQVFFTQRPVAVLNYARIEGTPLVLAGLLAGLGVMTLAHLLMISTSRRRRDLAILKTLGFVGRQLYATVAWQASALAFVALLVGLPVGVATGRWIWSLFAAHLGVAPDPRVPLVAMLLVVPVTLAVANLVAVPPGRVAGRLRPSVVLRGG